MYSEEAQRTIRIIEKKYNLDWNNKETLTNLTTLDLSVNQITDISFLKELTNLTTLDLSFNQISDIALLKELKNLIILDLSNNQISDISPLKELTNLRSLNLSKNQISDITPLKELKNLIILDLSNNQITDITPLKELTNLRVLNLTINQITDITPLKELTNLRVLNLTINQISDITPLKELKNLIISDLSNNQITDISPLKELTNSKRLNHSGNNLIEENMNCIKKYNYFIDKFDSIISFFIDRNIKMQSYPNIGGNKIYKSVKVDGNNQGIINTGNGNTILYNYENKTDYSEQLKTILARLPIGNIIFDAPKDIYYDEKKDVTLRISKNAIPTDNLSKENQIVKDNVKISPFMKARLLSDDFKINTLNNEEQIIDDSDFTEWKWSISPEEKLEKDGILRLRITIRIPIDIHREELKDMPIFEKIIAIYVKKAKIWKFF